MYDSISSYSWPMYRFCIEIILYWDSYFPKHIPLLDVFDKSNVFSIINKACTDFLKIFFDFLSYLVCNTVSNTCPKGHQDRECFIFFLTGFLSTCKQLGLHWYQRSSWSQESFNSLRWKNLQNQPLAFTIRHGKCFICIFWMLLHPVNCSQLPVLDKPYLEILNILLECFNWLILGKGTDKIFRGKTGM